MTITRKREHNYEKFIKPKRKRYLQSHKCIDCGVQSETFRCDSCNAIRTAYAAEWRRKNIDHVHKKAKEWRIKNPGKVKATNRRTQARQYDLSVDEYDILIKSACGICGSVTKKRAMDHCHVTNKVRGVLCIGCNAKLGWFEKNKDNVLFWVSKDNEA